MLLIGVKDSEYLPLENYPENYIGDLCPEKTRQALTILLYIVLRAELRGLDVEDLSKLQIVKQGLLHETPKIAKEGFEILGQFWKAILIVCCFVVMGYVAGSINHLMR